MTDTKTLRIKSPTDLLAAVPMFLGFHPRDSVVLLTTGASVAPCHARVDLPDSLDEVGEVAEQLAQVPRRSGTDQVAVVVYGDDPAIAEAVVDALTTRLREQQVAVSVALRADGERWYAVGGQPAYGPASGTPYDLSTHPITVGAIVEGRVVHDNREALQDSLVGTDVDEIDRVAESMGAALVRMKAVGHGGPAELRRSAALHAHLVQEGRWVQHRVRRFVRDRRPLDRHEVGRLLVAIIPTEVRDVAWAEITRSDARLHVELWHDVVRRSPFEAVAPPAALLAFAAWLSGDGALAWCAVDRAQAADPGYSMAALIAQVLASAMPPSAWQPMTPDMLTLFAS
jgi:hypothetical protein